MTMIRSIALVSGIALVACAQQKVLEPAPGAKLAPGRKDVAEAATAGVALKVSGDSWKGDPQDLGTLFTPILVTLQNQSGKTLRVSYQDFTLTGGSGFKYAAIPPMKAKGTISAEAASPRPRMAVWDGSAPAQLRRARFEGRGFYVAPHFSYLYPGFEPWGGPFAYDPLYYDTYYARWPERLPTRDMIAEALPEGAVQDGGSVSGFVYFQSMTGRESAVQFEMNLVDATNGSSFGLAAIPFQTAQN